MAKKTVAAKKRVVKVDGVGQLHVHSSFNNIIVTHLLTATDKLFRGLQPVRWDSVAQRKTHLMLLKWLLRIVQKLHLI